MRWRDRAEHSNIYTLTEDERESPAEREEANQRTSTVGIEPDRRAEKDLGGETEGTPRDHGSGESGHRWKEGAGAPGGSPVGMG